MILTRIILKNFGQFRDRIFDFTSGINLVTGPNEAGKSTLVESVAAALFGLRDKSRYLSWGHEGSSSVELHFLDGTRTLGLHRDLGSDRVCLQLCDAQSEILSSFDGKAPPQGRSSEKIRYLQLLREYFGLDDEELFRASYFIGQRDLALKDRGGLTQKLKSLLSGFAEMDYDQVLGAMQGDYFKLTRSNPWGKDKTRPRALEEVQQQLEGLKDSWQKAAGSSRELEQLREQTGALSLELESDRKDLELGRRYLDRIQTLWQIEGKEESLRRDFDRLSLQRSSVEELLSERDTIMARLAEAGAPEGEAEGFEQLLEDMENLQQELRGAQQEQHELRSRIKPGLGAGRLFFCFALMLAAGGALGAWSFPQMAGQILGPALGATALVTVLGLLRRRSAIRGRQALTSRYDELEDNRLSAQQRLDGFDETLERYGLPSSLCLDTDHLRELLRRCRPLWGRLAELDSALDVLAEPEALELELSTCRDEIAALELRREQEHLFVADRDLRPEELPDARDRLIELEASLETRQKRLFELRTREAALRSAVTELGSLEEEGMRLKEQECQLWQRKESLALGFDLLSEAVEEFRQSYLERFSDQISAQLQRICPGRYEQMRLGDDLSVELVGSDGQWHPLSFYSCGTTDAVYLAIRLALAEHLGRGVRLPLFLDDPLVNLDEDRLETALSSLKQMGEQEQVILLSHSEKLALKVTREKWHLITLGEKKSAKNTKKQENEDHVRQLHLL